MTSVSAGPPPDAARAAVRDGLLFGLLSYSLWGLFPLYLKLLSAIPATEILAHRIVWSVPFGALLIFLRKQWPEVKKALADRRVVFMLLLSACAIAFNWGIYVWAVVSDRVLEASLGYYINPLMSVAAGVFILGEKLRRAQIAAVILAGIGVLVVTVFHGCRWRWPRFLRVTVSSGKR
jgi:chloramphenicol-sensitive protein RarD